MAFLKETKGKSNDAVNKLIDGTPTQYPSKGRLIAILLCLVLGTFLVAIDTTIISVAIPTITAEFKALNDVGWYGSAYLMTLTAFQPTMSKLYKMFPPKSAYIGSIVLFEGNRFSDPEPFCFSRLSSLLARPVFGRESILILRSRDLNLRGRPYL